MIENQIDYETLKTIHEHAKKYDMVSDKKEFLKNVSPYEQKIILLNSHDPYEVLNYLDELDLKNSRIILKQLTYDEINKIIYSLSSEDKESFYNSFSDLDVVNQFISQDTNAKEHIQDLSFDRKVDILNSSDEETKEASSIVYETMTNEEKVTVEDKLTDVDGISALSDVVNESSEVQIDDSVNVVVEEPVVEVQVDLESNGQLENEQEVKEQTVEERVENKDDIKEQDKEELEKLEQKQEFNEAQTDEIDKSFDLEYSDVEKFSQVARQAEKQEIVDMLNKLENQKEQEFQKEVNVQKNI